MLEQSEIRQRELSLAPRRNHKTLSELAAVKPPGEGIRTGWNRIDRLILGLQPNRLNEFVAYTAHGKTSGMMSTVINNLDRDLLTVYASGDDSPESLLWKFIAMSEHMTLAQVMEQSDIWRQKVVAEVFSGKLEIATPDEGAFSADSLAVVLSQIEQDYGKAVDLFCFDYLGTLQEAANGLAIRQGAMAFKALVRTFPDTVFCLLHQCNRGAAGMIRGLETRHVEFAGVQEADGVMIGFRRRLGTEDLSDEEMNHEMIVPTVNISVMKNKVTGSISPVEGYRMAIDPISGRVRELTTAELHTNVRNIADVKFNKAATDFKSKFRHDDD